MKKILWRLVRFTKSEGLFVLLASRRKFFRRFIPRHNYYTSEKRTVVRDGVRYALDLSDYTQWKIYSYNRDLGARLAYAHLSGDACTILDIGSNVGAFSFELVSQFLHDHNRRVEIYTFEPNPVTYNALVGNVSINNLPSTISIKPFNIGLGARHGQLKLNVKKGHSGASTLLADAGTTLVDVWSLDEFVQVHKLNRVDFMKIDVECFEPFVLQGSHETITTFKPVIYLEHSIKCNERHQMGEDYIYNFLVRHGYVIKAEVDGVLMPISEFSELRAKGKVNILATAAKS